MRPIEKAYVAGFLDGDGSIYVKLTRNSGYKFKFQVAPYLVFYQSGKQPEFLNKLNKIINLGYIRHRNDGIHELIIGDVDSLKSLVKALVPYLILKKKQALLMLKVLKLKQKVRSADDFIKLSKLIDEFANLNYSKKRIINSLEVERTLRKEGLLTP